MTQTKLEIIGPYAPDHEGPFCTRDGIPARIICRDRAGVQFPIIALVREGEGEVCVSYSAKGKRRNGWPPDHDLMNAREVPVTRDGITKSILAIGTPVQGGELETLGYVPEGPLWNGSQFGMRNLYRTTEDEIWPRAVTGLAEAQAQIAARDAEIARLRDAITVIDKLIMGNFDPIAMFCGIHANCTEALKGGAA